MYKEHLVALNFSTPVSESDVLLLLINQMKNIQEINKGKRKGTTWN